MMFLMLIILLCFTDKAVCQNKENFKMQVDKFGEVWNDFVETSLGATHLQVIFNIEHCLENCLDFLTYLFPVHPFSTP